MFRQKACPALWSGLAGRGSRAIVGHTVPLKAFTLIELLVVICIVGILAALLLPALAKAKQSAVSIKCRSNLRQVGLGLTLYLNDFGAYPFMLNHDNAPPEDSQWSVLLAPYLQRARCAYGGPIVNANGASKESTTVNACPVNGPRVEGFQNLLHTQYGYNMYGLAWTPNSRMPQDSFLGLWGVGSIPKRPTKEGEVRSPANMIAFGDGTANLKLGRAGAYSGALFRSEQPVFLCDDGTYSQPMLDFARKRHRGRVNITFCDGHVENDTLKRFFLDVDSAALSRWNKDNQPHYQP